jgi:NMD protein affecting ribosome stability and mRNA decay
MNKNTTLPALCKTHKEPEHHRVKPLSSPFEFKTLPGHCYCTKCGAISFQKRWYIDATMEQHLRLDPNGHAVLCPGCTRLQEELYEGEVVLANAKFAALAGEIIALIRHIEGRCWHHNPLTRIAAFADDQAVIHIQTTTRKLAETIGKELHKTFKGKLEIKRSAEEKFVRIYWRD